MGPILDHFEPKYYTGKKPFLKEFWKKENLTWNFVCSEGILKCGFSLGFFFSMVPRMCSRLRFAAADAFSAQAHRAEQETFWNGFSDRVMNFYSLSSDLNFSSMKNGRDAKV